MFGNIILGLTFVSYLLLVFANLSPVRGTGDQNAGAVVYFFIFVAFAVLSLILTVIIAYQGGFNWISNSRLLRNAGIGVLWSGIIMGIFLCTLNKMEVRFGDQLQGYTRFFFLFIYNAGIWLPILMLLSYISILNPQWRFAISPNLFKILLLIACASGIITTIAQRKIRKVIAAKTPDYEVNIILNKINNSSDLSLALYYIGNDDNRLHNASINKIINQKKYEDEFQDAFESNYLSDIIGIYKYWDLYKVEHPERFASLINNNLPFIISEVKEDIENPYKGVPLDVENLCRVLNKHFKNYNTLFRSNMLKLQEVLELTPPIRARREDTQAFDETLNIYRLAVKNWLESNK